MPGTRVTCTDIDTGDTETRVIENDWSCLTTNKFWGEVHGSAHQLATHEGDPR